MANKKVLTEKELKQRAFRTFLMESGVALFACSFMGLELGAVSAQQNPANLIDTLLKLGEPEHVWWRIYPCDMNYVIMLLFVALIIIAYRYLHYQKVKDVDFDTAHGSAGFNEDLPEYNKKFLLNPKLLNGGKTEYDKEHKKITLKVDVISGRGPRGRKIAYIFTKYRVAWILLAVLGIANVLMWFVAASKGF